jgi:hypothetical protein
MSRREYELEELIPFGGGKATQEVNRQELAGLRAAAKERNILATLVERQDELLACYRLGRRPSASTLDEITALRQALDKLRLGPA